MVPLGGVGLRGRGARASAADAHVVRPMEGVNVKRCSRNLSDIMFRLRFPAWCVLMMAFSSSAIGAQVRAEHIILPAGISLTIPVTWISSRDDLGDYVRTGANGVHDASALPPRPSGHLILFGTTDSLGNEASIEISLMPTRLGQSQVEAMTPAALTAAERTFRSEIEAALANSGLRLVSWDGMKRVLLGGRTALLKHYRFRYPAKPEMTMESYGVYLGRRSVQLRLQFSTAATAALRAEVDGVRKSITFALAQL